MNFEDDNDDDDEYCLQQRHLKGLETLLVSTALHKDEVQVWDNLSGGIIPHYNAHNLS